MTAARSALDRIADSLEGLLELEREKRSRRAGRARRPMAEVTDLDMERARRALDRVRDAAARKR